MEFAYQPPDEYEHQIVVSEEGECKCGAFHEQGHALWGGVVDPRNMTDYDPFDSVNKMHSVNVEYHHSP